MKVPQAPFDPIAYINTPRWRGMSLGLTRMYALLSELGNPQDKCRFIHIAGTNGKGSTCVYIASVLSHAGYKCGRFTSPFIERFEERIAIDGHPIEYDDLLRITLIVRDAACRVEEKVGEHPTEFELMCTIALVYFAESNCDICVMEVGLGGRLDATNVIVPILSVITPIGLDHCDVLGNTLESIAMEKAGIIKPEVPVLSAPQSSEALEVIRAVCIENNCDLQILDERYIEDLGISDSGSIRHFLYKETEYTTEMCGVYQLINACLAIEACRNISSVFDISETDLKKGIAEAYWPGRFEIIGRNPLVIVDGAHNPQGAAALRISLENYLCFGVCDYGAETVGLKRSDINVKNMIKTPDALTEGIVFVMGMLADKDHASVLRELVSLGDIFVTYSPDNPRALDTETLSKELQDILINCCPSEKYDNKFIYEAKSIRNAVEIALEKAGPKGIVIAFGTLYAISEIKQSYRMLTNRFSN